MDYYYFVRNSVIHFFYTKLLKPIFFLRDPEDVHDFFLAAGAFFGRHALTRWKIGLLFGYKNTALGQDIRGIHFNNPVGLAAGFDKDGVLTQIIGEVGFGFAEVGSVTARLYEGNPRPRLWRLPKSRSLGVWYGLKNNGAKALAEKLKKLPRKLPLGISVAFTNCKENNDIDLAIADYVSGFKEIGSVADYLTINISCPNTQGGIPFIQPENYDKLMTAIDLVQTPKPVFVKISPDMSHADIDAFLEISARHCVHGIICSNLVKKYTQDDANDPIPPHGGLSGKIVFPKAIDLLSYMYKKAGDKFVFIFCGGVFSADDAYHAIRQGASLVQLITGMIFEGPQLISEINRGLAERLSCDGFKNISEVVGIDN
jgi:dihydroorotate dehydrogenase